MSKQNIIIVVLLAVGVIFFISTNTFDSQKISAPEQRDDVVSTPFFHLPSFKVPFAKKAPISEQAWTVFQNYLEYAKAHDLAGVISLSHQLSDICNDPERQIECFALMDNVYEVASPLEASEFKHIQSDDRQIIMSTDGPVVAILYFTIDTSGDPKVLGLGFCLEDETLNEKCVETDPDKRDKNSNGWWDAVEALFK